MIKRFAKISGTGKFLDYAPGALPPSEQPSDFGRFNLIYGDNGSGKTTLSLLLRSLRGDDGLLVKKRSFDHSVPQKVEVVTDSTTSPVYFFSGGKWDGHLPGIEVFDVHFINDNVYTGLEIQHAHRKKLFEVIIGQGGIDLKDELQVIKERIMKGRKMTREAARDIEAAIDGAFTAHEFAELQPVPGIETRIAEKEQELATANQHQEILQKPKLTPIPAIQPPFDQEEATVILGQSVDNISAEYLEKFRTHKAQLDMKGRAEDWIKQGYEAAHDRNACPFCQRPLDGTVEILEAYNQYFNEAYNRLTADITRLEAQAGNFNPEARLLEIENTVTANLTLLDFWKNHLGRTVKLYSLFSENEQLLGASAALKKCLHEKKANPVLAKDTAPLAEFMATVDTLNQTIGKFNADIAFFNSSIAMLKDLEAPNLPHLKMELKQLRALQKKNDPDLSAACKTLLTYEAALGTLTERKDTKQTELDLYKSTILDRYSTTINRYLQAFAPYLELRQLSSSYMGSSTEPSVKYALCIRGHKLLQKDTGKGASIKYSMSEGDKNALALSFFLASIELDEHISEKIIVLDDPTTHFDQHRTDALLDCLVRLAEKAQQLFLLTHSIGLANYFSNNMEHIPQGYKRYKLGEAKNSGAVVAWPMGA